MDIFNTIASGASAGSMVGGCIAVLTRQPKVMGAARSCTEHRLYSANHLSHSDGLCYNREEDGVLDKNAKVSALL